MRDILKQLQSCNAKFHFSYLDKKESYWSVPVSLSLSVSFCLSLSLAVARCRLASFTYYSSLSLPAADWRCFGVFGVERFKAPHTNWLFGTGSVEPHTKSPQYTQAV